MKRILSGSLKHLAPANLLRLMSAASPTGELELVTEAGSLHLVVARGRVAIPTYEELRHAGSVLRCAVHGGFRFEPTPLRPLDGDGLTLASFVEAALLSERVAAPAGNEVGVDRLLSGDIVDLARPASPANIHVLPRAPLANPLDELLNELEDTAPGELLFAQVGVLTHDPRLWRGSLESGWRRRGWRLVVATGPEHVEPERLDVLLLHQQHPIEDAAEQARWLELIGRCAGSVPPVPVVWAGRLLDSAWVYQLVDAGAAYLLPVPQGRSGGVVDRFLDTLAVVLERQLRVRQRAAEPTSSKPVCELVESLLDDAGVDGALGSLLQIAAEDFHRGAVLMVEETALRCRAGFGYPLTRETGAMPRGVGLLEQAIRSGEGVVGIDPESVGAHQLARTLGVDRLPAQTAVLPLGTCAAVGAVLVLDREGEALPDLRDLTLLACCLGGIVQRHDA